jgi:hypothetical protein
MLVAKVKKMAFKLCRTVCMASWRQKKAVLPEINKVKMSSIFAEYYINN